MRCGSKTSLDSWTPTTLNQAATAVHPGCADNRPANRCDAEKQPFRSMDFVSVIIVSALFALELPLVLL